jgi:membrane-associated phospholipid phosphatase
MRPAAASSAALILFLSCAALPPAAVAEGIPTDPVGDPLLLGAGFGLAGISEVLIRFAPPIEVPEGPDVRLIDAMDRAAMFPYSRDADIASSVTQYSAATIPLLMSLTGDTLQESVTDAIVYAESLTLAYGAKNVLKYLLPRYRPYVYSGGAPGIDPYEDDQSFPSTHTTMAFTAAAFTAYLYTQSLPGSASEWPFVVTGYALATLTAAYRVFSGMHFVTDVLGGAVLGTLCGFVVPSIVRR